MSVVHEKLITIRRTRSRNMETLLPSSLVKSFLAGSLSGTCSTLLFQPLDLVKTRLQRAGYSGTCNKGMLEHLLQIIKEEKVFGLWKGSIASFARCVPGVGIHFCGIHALQSQVCNGQPTAVEAVVIGATSRSFAGITLLPFTVIKTRFESGMYTYGTVRSALSAIYRTEGRRGLYSGLLPTLFRDVPFSGIYFMFYTEAKKYVPKSVQEGSLAIPANFGCGIAAGLLASLATQPADVIKTYMQLFPKEHPTIRTTIVFLYKNHGTKVFLRGLAPRLVRRSMMAALSWTVYEKASKHFGLK